MARLRRQMVLTVGPRLVEDDVPGCMVDDPDRTVVTDQRAVPLAPVPGHVGAAGNGLLAVGLRRVHASVIQGEGRVVGDRGHLVLDPVEDVGDLPHRLIVVGRGRGRRETAKELLDAARLGSHPVFSSSHPSRSPGVQAPIITPT